MLPPEGVNTMDELYVPSLAVDTVNGLGASIVTALDMLDPVRV
jgi:hypothetical protein